MRVNVAPLALNFVCSLLFSLNLHASAEHSAKLFGLVCATDQQVLMLEADVCLLVTCCRLPQTALS